MENKSKKDNLALTIGLALIILVVFITLFNPFSKKNDAKIVTDSKPFETAASDPQQISSDDLLKKIQNDDNVEIIDIRDISEFQVEHIAGSKNISLADIDKSLPSLNNKKAYIIVDADGSPDAINLAKNIFPANGFTLSFYLSGGFTAWKNQYNPTISEGDPNSFVDQAKVSYIDCDKLKEMISSGNNLLLIDVRNNASFQAEHLAAAINIPLDSVESSKDKIALGKKIVTYGNNGTEAFQASVRLYDLGFFNSLTLSEGFDVCKQKGLETAK